MTRFGMKEKEMRNIAEFMQRILVEDESSQKVKEEVAEFRRCFQKLRYCF
jgi:glycine hydroxymethyltransferase